jgi:large subunit ribosomal protein L30
MAEAKTIKVTLVGSPIGHTQRQRQTLLGLGLTRRGKSVVVVSTAATQGMIHKGQHLVRVE